MGASHGYSQTGDSYPKYVVAMDTLTQDDECILFLGIFPKKQKGCQIDSLLTRS